MTVGGRVIRAPSLAAGLGAGNAPGKFELSVEIIPTPFILAAQLAKWGMDVRSFHEPLKRSVQKVASPSFRKNFDVGGRPAWEPWSEVTVERREAQGFGEGAILVKTGLLKSVAGQLNIWTITRDQAAVSSLPRAPYGAVHQQGTSGGVGEVTRARAVRERREITQTVSLRAPIPARPWALLQPEDIDDIEEVFVNWFRERMALSGAMTPSVG